MQREKTNPGIWKGKEMTGSKSLKVVLIVAALSEWNATHYILVSIGQGNGRSSHEIFESSRNRKGISVSIKVKTYEA